MEVVVVAAVVVVQSKENVTPIAVAVVGAGIAVVVEVVVVRRPWRPFVERDVVVVPIPFRTCSTTVSRERQK